MTKKIKMTACNEDGTILDSIVLNVPAKVSRFAIIPLHYGDDSVREHELVVGIYPEHAKAILDGTE